MGRPADTLIGLKDHAASVKAAKDMRTLLPGRSDDAFNAALNFAVHSAPRRK